MNRNIWALLLALTVECVSAHATAFTSNGIGGGNLSAGATWVGGVAPNCASTDVITVVSGDTVNVDVSCALGSSAVADGPAITINGTSNVSFGTLTCTAGVTLTLSGFDTTTNYVMKVNQYGNFHCDSATVVANVPSDYGSYLLVNGHFNANGSTFTIPTANFNWNNAGASVAISNRAATPYDKANGIYVLKLITGTTVDPGPVSNSGGTALSTSCADTSFTITAGTQLTNCVASYASIASNGDYTIDPKLGVLWYKSASATLTLSYSIKYGSWFSTGISAQANTAGSSVNIRNSTFSYWGSPNNGNEFSYGAIQTRYKQATGISTDREVVIQSNTFNYVGRAIQISDSTANSSNHIVVSGNTFNWCRYGTGSFSNGLVVFGSGGTSSYLDFTNSTFNTYSVAFNSLQRGTINNVTFTGNAGTLIAWRFLQTGATASTVQNNTLTGFGGGGILADGTVILDSVAFAEPGAAGALNVFDSNTIHVAHRMARLNNYMTVTNNKFDKCYHHGTVWASANGYYFTGITFKNNITYNCQDSQNFGGGWTLGYNQSQWIDNVTIQHNTFDGGTRSIQFNDSESTVVLGTRLTITDNIASNSLNGIFQPANSSTNVSMVAPALVDYNDDYNNTLNPTNRAQAMFVMGGVNYNTAVRNVTGVYLWAPSGYTLPDATNRTLALTASGTAGTNLALNLVWSGGTAVNLVNAQGTATSGTTTSLTNTGATFTTTGSGLKGFQVIITSGTGSGQYGMIISNTATALTIVANTSNSAWSVAPDATSVYVVVQSQVTLVDSGASNNVQAGIYSPTLALTTQSDANITMTTHAKAVNPNYKSAATGDYTPTNSALNGAASDGTFIGALPVGALGTRRASVLWR